MATKHAEVDPKILAAFRKMVSAVPDVVVKGDAYPYTSVNGNMYSAISKAGRIGLRLPADRREAFMKQYNTGLHEPFPGFFMKEYVAVPQALLSNMKTLQAHFKASHEYAAALKAKPGKGQEVRKSGGAPDGGGRPTKRPVKKKAGKKPARKAKAKARKKTGGAKKKAGVKAQAKKKAAKRPAVKKTSKARKK